MHVVVAILRWPEKTQQHLLLLSFTVAQMLMVVISFGCGVGVAGGDGVACGGQRWSERESRQRAEIEGVRENKGWGSECLGRMK